MDIEQSKIIFDLINPENPNMKPNYILQDKAIEEKTRSLIK